MAHAAGPTAVQDLSVGFEGCPTLSSRQSVSQRTNINVDLREMLPGTDVQQLQREAAVPDHYQWHNQSSFDAEPAHQEAAETDGEETNQLEANVTSSEKILALRAFYQGCDLFYR